MSTHSTLSPERLPYVYTWQNVLMVLSRQHFRLSVVRRADWELDARRSVLLQAVRSSGTRIYTRSLVFLAT